MKAITNAGIGAFGPVSVRQFAAACVPSDGGDVDLIFRGEVAR